MLSTYKSRNKTEKLVLGKIKRLPEIKEHYALKKNGKPDVIIGPPYSKIKYYQFQVGFDLPDRFSTNYYLTVDPKTLQIYYEDFSDESGDKSISLQQWRYWRNKPGFNLLHKWEHGKLVVLKD